MPSGKKMPLIEEFKPMIMCSPENYENTKRFYEAIGFNKLWDNQDSACAFETGFGEQRFLVTLHYGIPQVEDNYGMLHFQVADAQQWYDYLKDLELEQYGAHLTPPVETPWGMYITYVADPSGLKLHFAQAMEKDGV